MEIDYDTKVYDLLKAYPQMQEYLITLSPRYKKLKNPILRHTIAKLASLRQASYLGGFSPEELVNQLRNELGQPPLKDEAEEEKVEQQRPVWAEDTAIATTIDATKLLDEDKNPLSHINKAFKSIDVGDVILLKSDFIPSPLIDEMRKKDASVVVVEGSEGWYETYVRKMV